MRILISNDDSIHAYGISLLKKIAENLGAEVWVVAPEADQSGVGHSISLSNPLRIRQVGERQFAVTGTPADCVVIAIKHIMPSPPDVILSGINAGANIGHALYYSGTMAAAREGMLNGILSLALSQSSVYCPDSHKLTTPFEVSEHFTADLLNKLFNADIPSSTLLNINFPACEVNEVKGVDVVGNINHFGYDLSVAEDMDPLLRPVVWLRPVASARKSEISKDSDVFALSQNKISITPLSWDCVQHDCIPTLQKIVS